LFFAITGVLLNHPTWLAGQASVMQNTPVQLQPAQLAAVRANSDPARAAVEVVRESLKLQGMVSNADMVGDDLFIRMKGARGSSDLRLNLKSGAGNASIETIPLPAVLNQLHRGETAGAVWRGFIDVAGALLVVSSILGLLLYLTLKMRIQLALMLVGGGLAIMVAGIVIFVR
jgi:hypothetical protein